MDINAETSKERMSLQHLPYDLLLNVAQHLELRDIQAMQLVSISYKSTTCAEIKISYRHVDRYMTLVLRGLSFEILLLSFFVVVVVCPWQVFRG